MGKPLLSLMSTLSVLVCALAIVGVWVVLPRAGVVADLALTLFFSRKAAQAVLVHVKARPPGGPVVAPLRLLHIIAIAGFLLLLVVWLLLDSQNPIGPVVCLVGLTGSAVMLLTLTVARKGA
jgi:hypothetical protein